MQGIRKVAIVLLSIIIFAMKGDAKVPDEIQRAELNRIARIEAARLYAQKKDILNWGRCLFPDKFPLPFCQELHGFFVSIRNEPFTSVEAPRNHAKTTIKCFLIPIFQALEEPESYRHYLNVQATDEKSLSVNRSIKLELEENEELRAIYGNQIGERWTDQQFVLKNGVIFSAKSAGQSMRGTNYRHIRPDYIIVDDLYDEEDLNNPESTQKKNSWFWGTLYLARARSQKCAIHVQGTAINAVDLLEEIKKKSKSPENPDGRWISRTFKAIKDEGQKIVLWPELNTHESLEQDRKDMGSLIFYRELQNERWDEATSIVKRSWLTKWEYDPVEDLRIEGKAGQRRLMAVLLLVDPSIGKNLENDDTAMVVMLKTRYDDARSPEYWIDYALNKHMTLNERILKLQEIADRRPQNSRITKAILEAVGGFQDFGEEAKRRTNLPITTIEKVKDKISNLMNKSVHFEMGRVHLNKHIQTETKDLIVSQLTTNQPPHDDLRDAILLGLDSPTSSVWDRLV